MDTVLLSRGFKWELVKERKPSKEHFSIEDYKASVDLAISGLPKGLAIEEVVLKSQVWQPTKDVTELQTTIYWKE